MSTPQSAERLIRSVCRAKENELREALRLARHFSESDRVPFASLPVKVRNAFKELALLRRRVDKLTKIIERAQVTPERLQNGQVRRAYHVVSGERRAKEQSLQNRIKRVEELRSAALIDSFGKPPAQLGIILQNLQKALRQL